MKKTTLDKPPYLKIVAVSVVILLVVIAGLVALQQWEARKGKFQKENFGSSSITYQGEEYVLKENVETFLVLGLDKFEGTSSADSYNNDMQADFLMLFVFDNDAKKCTAIHINRDTITDVNILGVAGNKIATVKKQIALAHTYGNGRDISCRNTADSLSSMLGGMRINHYVSVTLDSVPVFNDLVGGVELEILDDFTGIDDTLVKGETVTLMGEHALKYVRTRAGLEDSTNSTRMVRQRQYIN
ncbi:MAG: LCP family protein, partial [Clostridia bacterium]|nr:LCP family protein [Clostridia bacterium]